MPSVPRVLLLGLGVAVLAGAVFAFVDDTRGAVDAAVVAAGIVPLATWARSAAFQVGSGSPSRSSSGASLSSERR